MAIVVALANQKGGVAKTTTAINLSACLGALERRILLVDCDPQGNATRGLGLKARAPHLYHVLTDSASIRQAIVKTQFPGLSLLPSDRELVGVEVEFIHVEGWEGRLSAKLQEVAADFDFVFLDCPPSLGHLTVNALVAAHQIVVPLQAEYFALEGISELMSTVRRVQSRLNPGLQIGGVMVTMYDERNNLSQEVANEARKHFEDKVYKTVVPRNVRLAEAPSHGLPILHYDIKSKGAEAYLAIAREFLQRNA